MAAHEIVDSVEEGFRVVRLRAPDAGVDAAFVPALSMLGTSLRLGDAELLYRSGSLAQVAAERKLQGIPILHPWANRLEGDRFRVAGTSVAFDRGDDLVVRDGNGLPIHGLLLGAVAWDEVERHADADAARLVSRFAFGPGTAAYARFPFAHDITLAVRLCGTRLEFATTLRATGDRPVPVAFGFHPYFRLPDEPRADWLVALPVRRRLLLDERMIPDGRSEACAVPLAPLGARRFDDGFADVDPGARFLLQGRRLRLAVTFDSGFPYAQVYAPPGRDCICFEPMTAPANALISGDGLRLLAPGESFRAVWTIHLEPLG